VVKIVQILMIVGNSMVKYWLIAWLGLCVFPMPALSDVPKPRLKPKSLTEQPEPQQPAPAFPSVPFLSGWSKSTLSENRAECIKKLKGLKIQFEALAPIGKPGGCGAPAPLLVSSIAGVDIQPPAQFTCDMAEALHGWLSNSVKPLAQQHLKKRILTINNASAYVCRRRNGLANGKLSEHAKANALDIATLGFDDGSKITIKGDWSGLKQMVGLSGKGTFLRLIRRDACIRFTTVLGPGSDRYHGDHFHLDVARRKNGYRICK
jgi:hypothetical protein